MYIFYNTLLSPVVCEQRELESLSEDQNPISGDADSAELNKASSKRSLTDTVQQFSFCLSQDATTTSQMMENTPNFNLKITITLKQLCYYAVLFTLSMTLVSIWRKLEFEA